MNFIKKGTTYSVSVAFKDDRKTANRTKKFLQCIFPGKNILITPIDYGKVTR